MITAANLTLTQKCATFKRLRALDPTMGFYYACFDDILRMTREDRQFVEVYRGEFTAQVTCYYETAKALIDDEPDNLPLSFMHDEQVLLSLREYGRIKCLTFAITKWNTFRSLLSCYGCRTALQRQLLEANIDQTDRSNQMNYLVRGDSIKIAELFYGDKLVTSWLNTYRVKLIHHETREVFAQSIVERALPEQRLVLGSVLSNHTIVQDYEFAMARELGICYRPQIAIPMMRFYKTLFPALLFALMVGLCDGFFVTHEVSRFFAIGRRLPMELQMLLCLRVYGRLGDNISVKDFNDAWTAVMIVSG
jgi:hypothetical protein